MLQRFIDLVFILFFIFVFFSMNILGSRCYTVTESCGGMGYVVWIRKYFRVFCYIVRHNKLHSYYEEQPNPDKLSNNEVCVESFLLLLIDGVLVVWC